MKTFETGNYAVNIIDASTVPIYGLCFGHLSPSRTIVHPTGSRDGLEAAVVLECGDEQGEAVIGALNIRQNVRGLHRDNMGNWRKIK